MINNLDR